MEYLNSYGKLYSQGKLEMDIAEERISAIQKNIKMDMKSSDSNETSKTEWNKKQNKERINIEEMK